MTAARQMLDATFGWLTGTLFVLSTLGVASLFLPPWKLEFTCGESSTNLTLPYAYAAAYVIVTQEQPTVDAEPAEIVPVEQFVHLTSEEAVRIYVENEAAISKVWESIDGTLLDAVTYWMAQKQLNEPAVNDVPPAPSKLKEPEQPKPQIAIYGYEGCRGCEWADKQFTQRGIAHKYLKVTPIPGVEYPYADIDGKRLSYLEIQEWLKGRKETK